MWKVVSPESEVVERGTQRRDKAAGSWELHFDDGRGVRWLRDDLGRQSELLPNDPRAVHFDYDDPDIGLPY